MNRKSILILICLLLSAVMPAAGAETEGIGYEPILIYARTDDYLTVQKILSVQPNKTDAGL